jgi:hypothetical protein
MGPILQLWLGKEFGGLDAVLIAAMLAEIPMALGATAQQVLTGLGQLNFMAPILFLRGLLGFLAAWAYITWISPSLAGATACVVGARAIGALIVHMHASKVTDTLRVWTMFETVVWPMLLASAGAGVTWAVGAVLGTGGWLQGIAAAVAGEGVFCILMLTIGLNAEERKRLWAFGRMAGVKFGLVQPARPRPAGE